MTSVSRDLARVLRRVPVWAGKTLPSQREWLHSITRTGIVSARAGLCVRLMSSSLHSRARVLEQICGVLFGHVTQITRSDWLIERFGGFLPVEGVPRNVGRNVEHGAGYTGLPAVVYCHHRDMGIMR